MASLTYDSELMNQHVAAIAVPNSRHFTTVRNCDGSPIVFSLGTDNKLYLIINDRQGQRLLRDFGYDCLRLNKDYKVYAFAVVQDVNEKLYIILATGDPDSTSDLITLEPFTPAEYDMADKGTDLRLLKLQQKGEPTRTIVKGIHMTNSSPALGQLYPPVILTFQPLHRISVTQDIARLFVDESTKEWDIQYDLSLPENAFKMLALQPVNLPLRVDGPLPGFVAIYEIQDKPQLMFVATREMNSTYTKKVLECPTGALTLSSFVNSDGYTDLLVGGNGLYHFPAGKILKTGTVGTQISNSGVFSSLQQLHVTQAKSGISVWGVNTVNGIGYLTSDSTLKNCTNPIQLIPDGQGGVFSPFRPANTDQEQFIVADKDGKLTLLQYDCIQHLWDQVPFFTPALEKTVEFRSYTTQITLKGADKMPLVGVDVSLKCSGQFSVIVNGNTVITSPNIAVSVKTDSSGYITIIAPTTGISSYEFNVEFEGRSWAVDPTEKVNRVLDSIHSADDLLKMELPNGGMLMDGTKLKRNEIEQAAKAIEAVQRSRKDILNKKVEGVVEFEGRVQLATHATVSTLEAAQMIGPEPEVMVKKASSGNGFVDMLWDAWYWLESMASKVIDWSIQKLSDGVAFIVQIGERFYRWVMDGLAQVGKALTWLFDKVLDIGEKVVEWLGFLFNWGDIKATKNSIVHLTNSAIDCGVEYIGTLQTKVDGFFNGIITQLKEAAGKPRPASINNITAKSDTGDKKSNDSITSTKANWSQYQFVHGGGASASVIHGKQSTTSLEDLWTNVILPLKDTIQGLVEDLANLIVKLFFNGDKSLSVEQAMQQITGELLVNFVDGIRKVAVGIVGVIRTLVTEFKDLINAKITIPIFSSLYKNYLSGSDLTMLDGIALILAIPITIIYKLITGRAPPDMTCVSYKEIIDCTVKNSQQRLDFNHFTSITSLVGNGIDGLLATASIVTSGKAATSPSLFSTKSMSPSATAGGAANGGVSKGSWKDVLGVISRIASIPSDSSLPAFEIRWISWVISCINTLVEMAGKFITAGATALVEKALAVVQGALAAINYALLVAIKVIEFQTTSFPGKNDMYEGLKLTCGTLDLLGSLSDGVGIIAADPKTKGWATLISVATKSVSYSIEGGMVAAKVADGEFNEILPKIL